MKRLQKNDDCLKGIMQATKRNGDVRRRMFTTPIGVFEGKRCVLLCGPLLNYCNGFLIIEVWKI